MSRHRAPRPPCRCDPRDAVFCLTAMRLRQRIGQLRQLAPIEFGGVSALDQAIQQYQEHLATARRFWEAHPG